MAESFSKRQFCAFIVFFRPLWIGAPIASSTGLRMFSDDVVATIRSYNKNLVQNASQHYFYVKFHNVKVSTMVPFSCYFGCNFL